MYSPMSMCDSMKGVDRNGPIKSKWIEIDQTGLQWSELTRVSLVQLFKTGLFEKVEFSKNAV